LLIDKIVTVGESDNPTSRSLKIQSVENVVEEHPDASLGYCRL